MKNIDANIDIYFYELSFGCYSDWTGITFFSTSPKDFKSIIKKAIRAHMKGRESVYRIISNENLIQELRQQGIYAVDHDEVYHLGDYYIEDDGADA